MNRFEEDRHWREIARRAAATIVESNFHSRVVMSQAAKTFVEEQKQHEQNRDPVPGRAHKG